MQLCESCIATFGVENAMPARVKTKSLLDPKKVRHLCEEHAYRLYLRFGGGFILEWPDWETHRQEMIKQNR